MGSELKQVATSQAAPRRDLRARAAYIVNDVNNQLDQLETSGRWEHVSVVGGRLPGVLGLLFRVIDSVDPAVTQGRVTAAQAKYPHLDKSALAKRLIRDKALQTGAVGATTSAAGTIPGLGTLASVTLGVTADVIATFRLQVELVMELAQLMGYEMSRTERRTAILAITGLGAGLDTAAKAVGTKVATYLGEEYAEKAILKAIPIVGLLASAGVNVLMTRVVGNRALAYFRGKQLGEFTQDITGVSDTEAAVAAGWWQASQTRARDLARQIGPVLSTARLWTAERARLLLPRRGEPMLVLETEPGPAQHQGVLGKVTDGLASSVRWVNNKIRRR
ncbi:MAG: hypothetical protein KIT87_28205 [Anaerolineae bacterium]|nr:hypothetical protein [Anaerolineae bacterium]